MDNEVSFLRHAGWISPEELTDTLIIVGCGAVGSNLALTAAKMGFHDFSLWDADIVENHNLPNQAFDLEHIGMKKVDALEQVLKRFNPSINVSKNPGFLLTEHKDSLEGLMVIATDTMSSRYDFHEIFKYNPELIGVFECRLGFDYGEVNYIDPMNSSSCDNFLNGLRPDDEVPEGPCNKRICTTLVGMVSNYAVHTMCAKYVAEKEGETWTPSSKTMFELSPGLSVFSL